MHNKKFLILIIKWHLVCSYCYAINTTIKFYNSLITSRKIHTPLSSPAHYPLPPALVLMGLHVLGILHKYIHVIYNLYWLFSPSIVSSALYSFYGWIIVHCMAMPLKHSLKVESESSRTRNWLEKSKLKQDFTWTSALRSLYLARCWEIILHICEGWSQRKPGKQEDGRDSWLSQGRARLDAQGS